MSYFTTSLPVALWVDHLIGLPKIRSLVLVFALNFFVCYQLVFIANWVHFACDGDNFILNMLFSRSKSQRLFHEVRLTCRGAIKNLVSQRATFNMK